MDSEEAREIAHRDVTGHPQTDEGRYYHKAGWEGYKGSIKGLLAGLLIGGGVGAGIGAVAGGALMLMTGGSAMVLGGAVLAGAAWGMYEGEKKFSQVWMTTGVVAAAQEISEHEMKQYIKGRFIELKQDLGVKHDSEAAKKQGAPDGYVKDENGKLIRIDDDEIPDYTTKHCDDHCPPLTTPFFWRVGAIGAAVGAAAGGLLGFVPGSEMIAEEVLHLGADKLGGVPIAAATSTIGATIGASFGVNRDIFRRVHDVTDQWFRGIAIPDHSVSPEIEQAQAIANGKENTPEKTLKKQEGVTKPAPAAPAITFAEPAQALSGDFPTARVNATEILLAMDHTRSVRQ